ncbi:hypothetical protein FRB93_010103 [Tulasnella sp. JGI-2019a]|nr:hypothetical protein FRB93_010103 [Tulasnella sp. JGI-2019a]
MFIVNRAPTPATSSPMETDDSSDLQGLVVPKFSQEEANNSNTFNEWLMGTYMRNLVRPLTEAEQRLAECAVHPNLQYETSLYYPHVPSDLTNMKMQLMAETVRLSQQQSTQTTSATPQPQSPNKTTLAIPTGPGDELLPILPTILMTASELQMMKDDDVFIAGPFSEMNWRAPVDTLLRRVFNFMPRSSTFRYEVSIHMPSSAAPVRTGEKRTMGAGWFLTTPDTTRSSILCLTKRESWSSQTHQS